MGCLVFEFYTLSYAEYKANLDIGCIVGHETLERVQFWEEINVDDLEVER